MEKVNIFFGFCSKIFGFWIYAAVDHSRLTKEDLSFSRIKTPAKFGGGSRESCIF